jgi:hypothetical protein
MRRDEAAHGVNNPPQELFACRPVGHLSMLITLVIGSEEQIECVEHMVACLSELGGHALSEGKEVINKTLMQTRASRMPVGISLGGGCGAGRRVNGSNGYGGARSMRRHE